MLDFINYLNANTIQENSVNSFYKKACRSTFWPWKEGPLSAKCFTGYLLYPMVSLIHLSTFILLQVNTLLTECLRNLHLLVSCPLLTRLCIFRIFLLKFLLILKVIFFFLTPLVGKGNLHKKRKNDASRLSINTNVSADFSEKECAFSESQNASEVNTINNWWIG